MKLSQVVLALLLASPAAAIPAAATPVQWTVASGGNDHWYELIAPELLPDFDQAVILAQGLTWQGLGGYLATVTSAGEWRFLDTVVNPNHVTAWLGGSDEGSEGSWMWVTEPGGPIPFTFTAWNAGEPNNCCGGENALHGWYGAGWNDIPAGYIYPYVVEFSPVPVPASLPLLAGAVAGIAALRRRRG